MAADERDTEGTRYGHRELDRALTGRPSTLAEDPMPPVEPLEDDDEEGGDA